MALYEDALDILEATSRTFFIPVSRLPTGLLEAVASAYLCMRAIDEIEDHPQLDNNVKADLLRTVGQTLQTRFDHSSPALTAHRGVLPEVTIRVGEWALLAPETIAPRIWDATAAMADRMALWADNNWEIRTEADLDRYTFSVAGTVGLLLSDLWAWYDGTQTNRVHALGFGRGLQSVNILRNHEEDLARGVEFFPDGWSEKTMEAYVRRNLLLADAYADALPPGPALDFCKIPLGLAYATLDVLARGERSLSRTAVLRLVEQLSPQRSRTGQGEAS